MDIEWPKYSGMGAVKINWREVVSSKDSTMMEHREEYLDLCCDVVAIGELRSSRGSVQRVATMLRR